MIAREHKVPLRTLPLFFKTARRSGKQGLVFYWQKHAGNFQVSVVVPKKVAALATVRSAVRRSVYQVLQEKLQTTELLAIPVQVVIIIEKKWLSLGAQEQQRTIESVLEIL